MEDKMKTTSRQRSFKLLEDMVVAVIRGIIATLVAPKIIIGPGQTREIAAKQDIEGLMQALKFYRLDNQRYPVTEQGLQALLIQPTIAPFPTNWKSGGYIGRLPRDPWGNPYQYLYPGVYGEIDIYSLGADDEAGGEDNDTDIRLLVSQG
jgi:general secretion pathway protein G